MTRLSSRLSIGIEIDVITGVVIGSSFQMLSLYRMLDSSAYRMLGFSMYRILGVIDVITRFVGLFVIGIAGASNDAIEVVDVLSRGDGSAETSRSIDGPSLGSWSWWG